MSGVAITKAKSSEAKTQVETVLMTAVTMSMVGWESSPAAMRCLKQQQLSR